MRILSFVLIFLQLASSQSTSVPLDRIRARILVDSLPNLTASQIAGRYTNPSKELVKRVGPPLRGEDLYVFIDHTYVYCKWADIMPNTIFDKGRWSFGGGVLALKSDKDIAWNPKLERRFLPVRRRGHTEEVLLVGADKSVSYFADHAGDDPELMLLIVSLPRVSQPATTALKTELMHERWHPELFKNK